MKPKERNLFTEIDMTKYQNALLIKRAVKKEISKEKQSPKANIRVVKESSLPDYIAKNPWY